MCDHAYLHTYIAGKKLRWSYLHVKLSAKIGSSVSSLGGATHGIILIKVACDQVLGILHFPDVNYSCVYTI